MKQGTVRRGSGQLRLRLTENTWERLRGLLGRPRLDDDQALWIKPCNSVHSGFMRYSLDLVYLDAEHHVLRCVRDFRPWRLSFCAGAGSVLELAAGSCGHWQFQPGEALQIELQS